MKILVAALKVTDDGRDQLGHLQPELVPELEYFPVLIVNLLISNHFKNKDFNLNSTETVWDLSLCQTKSK